MIAIKKGLLILYFVLLTGAFVSAATNPVKRVFISESFELYDKSIEQFFFFFCGGFFIDCTSDNVFMFFSNAVADENVEGNFYLIFSELRLPEKPSDGCRVKTLFSKVYFPHDAEIKATSAISQIFDWTGVFIKNYTADGLLVRDDSIGPFFFLLAKSILAIGFYCIFLAIRKSVFEQGALAVKREYRRILKGGLVLYSAFLCAIVVFFLMVFGIAFSLLIALLLLATVMLGSAALCLYIGGLAAEAFGFKRGVYKELVIGAVMTELCGIIPVIGIVFSLVIVPILALGITYVALMNMYISKNYYESPYVDLS